VRNLLEEMRDDSAKQVLAFRNHADQLADEARVSEESAEELRAQLRKNKTLLAGAVRTIETLKEELQSDDSRRHDALEDSEKLSNQVGALEKRLQQSKTAMRGAQTRCAMHQEEARRTKEARDRMAQELDAVHAEMESLQKVHEETRRNLLHMQRCARNAQTIENNAARFLRGSGVTSSTDGVAPGPQASGAAKTLSRPASASASRNRKASSSPGVGTTKTRTGAGAVGALHGSSSLPEIGSPQPAAAVLGGSKIKRGREKKGSSGGRHRLRPDSAPLQRKDMNRAATPGSKKPLRQRIR
jgi:septal ring factor EnvC (AmiA/AmiB activator)